MSFNRLPGVALARHAAAQSVARPSTMIPALVLLLPTVLLQLFAVEHLRTRLAPAMWTVVVGGVFLAWWQQVATMAAMGLVGPDGIRLRAPRWRILRVALDAGTRVTAGLALFVVPGLWLQARYAFAPLLAGPGVAARQTLARSVTATRPQQTALIGAMATALLGGLGLQSLVAVAAEAFETIHAVGSDPAGHAIFAVRLAPHVATSLLAWAAMAWLVTVQALAVHAAYREELESSPMSAASSAATTLAALGAHWRLAGRLAGASALAAGLLAVLYKVQQHIS